MIMCNLLPIWDNLWGNLWLQLPVCHQRRCCCWDCHGGFYFRMCKLIYATQAKDCPLTRRRLQSTWSPCRWQIHSHSRLAYLLLSTGSPRFLSAPRIPAPLRGINSSMMTYFNSCDYFYINQLLSSINSTSILKVDIEQTISAIYSNNGFQNNR